MPTPPIPKEQRQCACGCGRWFTYPDRRKFATEACTPKGRLRHLYRDIDLEYAHEHPCNSGVAGKDCLAYKTGVWLAPNKFTRTCPVCREVLLNKKICRDYTEDAILVNV